MSKKLSIITINRNDAQGLEKTMRSVTAQTFRDFEYIVIDGGSTDGSVEIIKKYADKITYWISEKDSGIYEAMNKGIKKAQGEYCQFLNSGDYLCNEMVLADVFSKNISAGIAYGDLMIAGENGNLLHKDSPAKITTRKMLADTLWHPVSFIQRGLFAKYGLYDESFRIAGDYEFFLRIIIDKKTSMQHIPLDIAVYNMEGLSSREEYKKTLLAERKKAQDRYFNSVLLFLFRLYSNIRN